MDSADVACENCGLMREQPDGSVEDGVTNDNGWWCAGCVSAGHKRTQEQDNWSWFATDYPEYASELKRLRKITMSYGGE